MNIIFLGPPGVGKGTQCKRVAERFHWPHVSTGEIMRAEINRGSTLGQTVSGFVNAGQLVPDRVVIEIIAQRIKEPDCQNGCIFDGFPRTVQQAEMLERLFRDHASRLAGVIQLVADDELVTQRLVSRAAIEGRSDDTPATIASRLQVYHAQTAPLTDYYQQRGALIQVDGTGTPEEVFQHILSAIQRLDEG